MVFVTRKKGDSKETIFRKFTRSFIEEDILNEVKNRLFYKKPSLIKKEEAKERLKNRFKKRNLPRLTKKW
jgi:ribosomal protein S21